MRTTANTFLLSLIILFMSFSVFAQSDSTSKKDWGKYIFIPAIEIGYMHNNSSSLSGGLLLKTSLEYRIKNDHAPFFRLNYDTYNAKYKLEHITKLTNILQGTVAFSDLLLGVGYRFGSEKFRCFMLAQSGIKFYDYPNMIYIEPVVTIEKKNQINAVSRFTVGMEYYINPKSAFSIDLLYSQTWSNDYFWKNQGGAIGISIGFITTLF